MRPQVVICGRPNVGKSTLFNVLLGKAKALVHNRPGITRDWLAGELATEKPITLIDTAGLESKQSAAINRAAWQRSIEQIQTAKLVLLMVDARAGLLPDDRQLATLVRKHASNVILVVNKAENLTTAAALTEFHQLGFARNVVISAVHAQGLEYLRDTLHQYFAQEEPEPVANEDKINLALLGRPNVGKSTLTNKIIGHERMLVADKPGTTIDSVATDFVHRGRDFALVDTAGVRRKAKIDDNVEKISTLQARKIAQAADIIMFMFDAAAGIVHQDQLLADLIQGYGKATLIIGNKADLLAPPDRRKVQAQVKERLPFMEHAPFVLISAMRKRFSAKPVIDKALASFDQANQRTSANKITKVLRLAVTNNEPPRRHGKRPSLRYAHQAGVNPPLIIVHGRHVELVKSPYTRYLASQFAKQLNYGGAPLQIRYKETA